MAPKAKTDVSKVSSEPHKYKSPALRFVNRPTSQKAGQDEKGTPGAVHQGKEEGLPEVADRPPPTLS